MRQAYWPQHNTHDTVADISVFLCRWLQWPGAIKAPLPSKAKTQVEMEKFGYQRKPQWSHIQRSIDDRQQMLFHQRYYGGPGPKTASMRLPWPKGFDQNPNALPVISDLRPKTAP